MHNAHVCNNQLHLLHVTRSKLNEKPANYNIQRAISLEFIELQFGIGKLPLIKISDIFQFNIYDCDDFGCSEQIIY